MLVTKKLRVDGRKLFDHLNSVSFSEDSGIRTCAAIAAATEASAAIAKANEEECTTTRPPIAEPSGRPDMLKLMDTASTRPSQSGSVRRCLSDRTPTSTGPSNKPAMTRPAARPTRPKLALTG